MTNPIRITVYLFATLLFGLFTNYAGAEQSILVPDSRKVAQEWKYTVIKPGKDWNQSDFDESKWQKGVGGFGRQGTPGAVVRTNWLTNTIWMRRTFQLKEIPKEVSLTLHHDEDVQVYINGDLVFAAGNYTTKYHTISLSPKAVKSLKVGENLLAVHCRQTRGGQYIDVGLTETVDLTNLVQKSKTASPEMVKFFEKEVKPILKDNCFRCHGDREKVRGGLNLTSQAGLLKGGDTGPAVLLKSPEKSLFLKMINYVDDYHQMPPRGKLPMKELDILTKWVNSGIPWTPGDTGKTVVKKEEPAITEKDRNYWAYKKVTRPDVPDIKESKWANNPIDHFILAKLQAKGLTPVEPADKVALIRRVTYDLTGLPPTPAEVKTFLKDTSERAYEKLIDRLLASPHYGEKWARHWLDLVRYAETNGYEFDETKPFAWKYRDWVIGAFNKDMPYDQFITAQLAGDEIDNPTRESRIATGYFRLGIFDTHAPDNLMRDFDMYDDLVSTTGQVMLGMSLGCARCHDHKGDPIPQEDYYRFLAFFRGVRPAGHSGAALNKVAPGEMALTVSEGGKNAPPTHVLVRGNPHVKTRQVVPGFPQVLGFDEPNMAEVKSNTTGRRLTLAKWLTHRDNPLTARVFVNRMWQHHFGRGLVRSPNDFGKFGQSPTHPELLDWLAAEFMENGWSIKQMHKLMLTSSTYRMSSKFNKKSADADPLNDLFWRFEMRRLTAEEIRDSILAVDGTLDRKIGGPSVFPELPVEVIRTSSKYDRRTGFIKDGFWKRPKKEYEVRRTIYTFIRRSLLPPMLTSLDLADTDQSCPVRFVTTVPTQALTMLNSKFMADHSKLLAERLKKEAGTNVRDRVTMALHLVTQRQPGKADVDRGVQLIGRLRKDGISEDDSLRYFCLVALNLNEFVYLD